jgi:hypothetical protein
MPQGSAPVTAVSTVPLPQRETYELLTRGMPRWWPYGHRLGDVELATVHVDATPGGRWHQRDVRGVERELGVVVEAESPTRLVMRSLVGVDYSYDERGLVTVQALLTADDDNACTTVTWTLSGFELLGPGGSQLREDFAGRYGWRDMADALSGAVHA